MNMSDTLKAPAVQNYSRIIIIRSIRLSNNTIGRRQKTINCRKGILIVHGYILVQSPHRKSHGDQRTNGISVRVDMAGQKNMFTFQQMSYYLIHYPFRWQGCHEIFQPPANRGR